MKKFKLFLLALGVVVLGTVVYYAYSIYDFVNDIQPDANDTRFQLQQTGGGKEPEPPPKWEGKERVNILLIGADARGISESELPRSDTLMLVSIDPVTKKAHLLSLMRDTYVNIPDHYSDRINAALAIGGPQLAMKTVSGLLDMPVQYYVYTDFEGFVKLVDAIGGIDFEVEKRMVYRSKADGEEWDIDLEPGMQHLNGSKALQYVRFRYDAMSDYARTERQRNLMTEVAKKLKTTTSIIKLPQILNDIKPYIRTNLTAMEMVKLGTLALDINPSEIESVQIPPSHLLQEKTINGADVIVVNEEALRTFMQEILETDEHEDEPKEIEVENNTQSGKLTKE